MRIVGGILGGRRITAPPSMETRPTSDRVREGIASALEARDLIRQANVLDLFAGTGAFSFEMLSRGAQRATLVENNPRSVATIRANAGQLNLHERIDLIRYDLSRPLKSLAQARLAELGPFDLIFFDPPYAQVNMIGRLVEELSSSSLFASSAVVVAEFPTTEQPELPAWLQITNVYPYGDTSVLLGTVTSATDGV
jgi:16S rRNA (guanine966-N2)-methyltransferase